jgi:hypothetical protein
MLLADNREMPLMIPGSDRLKYLTGAPRVPEDREASRFLISQHSYKETGEELLDFRNLSIVWYSRN